MADDGSATSSNLWPLSRFHFEVTWDGQHVMHFQEVSGLDAEAQPIEFRHGNSTAFSVTKMPGIKKYTDVTLKKGRFKGGDAAWAWFSELKMNSLKRQPVTISLLDEAGQTVMVWTLAQAWPSKVTGTESRAAGDEVTVETIVLVHEGMTIAKA